MLDRDMVGGQYAIRAFVPAWPSDRRRLPGKLAANARAYVGMFQFPDYSDRAHPLNTRVSAMLVVTPGQSTVLYTKVNGDTTGSFTDADRHMFTADTGPQAAPGDESTTFSLPLPKTAFRGYPVHVIMSPAKLSGYTQFYHYTDDDLRCFLIQGARVQGHVTLNGRPTIAQFDVSPVTGKVNTIGWYSMDCTGDGTIDPQSKTENQNKFRTDVPVMFKVDDTYVTPGLVDEQKGTFTLRGISAAEYVPPLDTGVTLADMSFMTLDSVSHHLSDYHGKYVLVDFWTLNCGPCIAELPNIAAAYATYHERGLEVLGVNLDVGIELNWFKTFLSDKKATWMQTSTTHALSGDVLAQYVNLHGRIWSFPTAVLVGPDGRVVALDGESGHVLEGAALPRTLERFLPAAPPNHSTP